MRGLLCSSQCILVINFSPSPGPILPSSRLCSAFLASVPRHPFWLIVLSLIYARKGDEGGAEMITGPVVLKEAVDRMLQSTQTVDGVAGDAAGGLTVLPPGLIFPYDWHQRTNEQVRPGGDVPGVNVCLRAPIKSRAWLGLNLSPVVLLPIPLWFGSASK